LASFVVAQFREKEARLTKESRKEKRRLCSSVKL